MSRASRLALVCALQLGLVGAAVWPSLSARLTGEEYRLAVAPVDPIDPFRGAYVTLAYPGLADALPEDLMDADDPVYVPLERVGGAWAGGTATRQRPDRGPYLRCTAEYRLRCGIESFFASQATAKRLERELSDGALARIRVDGRGNAAIVGIESRG